MSGEGQALGEGLYWMAEKLRWGYEDIAIDRAEALRLYRQAASLDISDAHVRIGEFYEQGQVVARNPTAALRWYKRAYVAGNPYGHAAVAKLLARTEHYERAEQHWTAVFGAIAEGTHTKFLADDAGAVIHSYIGAQLRHGLPVRFLAFIRRHRQDIVGHHQAALEHAHTDSQFEKLSAIGEWLSHNLTT